jgi:hypothetical protein
VYNDDLEVIRHLDTKKERNLIDNQMNQTLICDSRVSLKEFILLDLDTPEKPTPCFFSSFYFFEPLLVPKIASDFRSKIPMTTSKPVHPFKRYFPSKDVIFSPKVIVLQSRKPYFSATRTLLEFIYKILFESYVKGTTPIQINPRILNLISKKEHTSILKFKEFVFSVILSIRLPPQHCSSLTFDFKHQELKLDSIKHQGQLFSYQTIEFLEELINSNEKLEILIKVFFHLITEKQLLIVCSQSASLYSILSAIIMP